MNEAPESANEFWKEFNAFMEKMREEIKVFVENPVDVSNVISKLKLDSSSAQKYATISTPTLPAYDVRRSQEIIEVMNKELKVLESKYMPKKAFKFGSKNKTTEPTPTMATEESVSNTPQPPVKKEASASAVAAQDTLPPGSYPLMNLVDQTIVLRPADLNIQENNSANVQLFIKNNRGCSFTVPSLLGTVRIENTHHCSIFLGPTCTSVYIEDSSHLTVFIACHQLRIHKTTDCQLYVRVNSHPIVEDCANMGFAPYTYSYENIAQDITSANLERANCWDNVVDFRWHRSTHSPNWYVIDEDKRLQLPVADEEK